MASSTTTWLLLQWIEDPPQWDVIEVGKCGAELKLMALGKKLQSAVGNIYDMPWNGETAPAKVLDFGKDKAMEAKHTEQVKNYEAAMEVGRKNGKSLRCANKRMADELSESESTSSDANEKRKVKRKKVNDEEILISTSAIEDTDSSEENGCQGCKKLPKLKEKYKLAKEKINRLEAEIEHYKQVTDARSLVDNLKMLIRESKTKEVGQAESQNPNIGLRPITAPVTPTSAIEKEGTKQLDVNDGLPATPGRVKETTKVDIGRGVLVEKTSLMALSSVKSGSTYARRLLKTIFTDAELVGKSLTGRKSNAFKDQDQKPALDPTKVEAVVDLACRKFGCPPATIKMSLANKLKEITKKAAN
ncbi:uncharacterized protein LOC132889398 [Neoarius graeffei]|uniref:uncharacterized protein LOC132889398 n=1 Tax=Neoarius graeffei TaxID=443677 RepID=UPI00298D0AA2|nr:uncharacterized protein LOC132889398 [Neoarius graeffei]